MIPRRTFLRQSAAALPALWLWPSLAGPQPELPYGLFFDGADLPRLRARYQTPRFATLRDALGDFDLEAEARFIEQEVDVRDHLFHLMRLYKLAVPAAFTYAMTGDETAAILARDAVRAIMRFPKWDYFLNGPEHVLGIQRAAGSVVATACAADWLGDVVSDEERAAWIRTMGERGCEACYRSIYGMRHPDRVLGWHIDPESTYLTHRPHDRDLDLTNWPFILDATNLKAVPASALAIGAAAYERAFGRSAQTDRWVEQATFSVRSFGDLFARDGSYDEGISYANYTAEHLAQATEVLARLRGADLYDVINWPGFIDYGLGLTMPTADDPYAVVNFGDAGTGLLSAVPYWVASRAGDARAQWYGDTLTRGHSPWSLLWYDGAVTAEAPPAGPTVWHSDLDWITARTGYAPDDLVVALRSGGPSNHEHGDRGGLIVKAFGEVLVADPYRPTYNNDDPGWLLRTTAGHSALLIDGEGHQYHDGAEGTNASDAVARLVRVQERDGYALWTSDATPAYRLVRPDLTSVTRTVLVLYDAPAVVVVDKVLTEGDPVRLQARFFADNRDGQARVTAEGETFAIERPRASLHATVLGGTAVAERLPLPEEQAQAHPFAEAQTPAAHASPMLVTVLQPHAAGREAPALTVDPSDPLAFDVAGRAIRIADTGRIPEVMVAHG